MADVEKRIYPAQEEPVDVMDDSTTIELEDPRLAEFNGEDVPITPLEDGSILVGEGEMLPQQVEFGANLADELEDSDLQTIFNQCVADVEADLSSRSEWEQQYRDGLEFLGMRYEERSQPFEGASGITHPLLAESVTQFQAQAYAEILPSQGPVKTQIVGAITPDSEGQAARVKEYMNYQLMHVMEEYDPETDMLLFYLPLSGSAFRKVYYDQTLGRAVSRLSPVAVPGPPNISARWSPPAAPVPRCWALPARCWLVRNTRVSWKTAVAYRSVCQWGRSITSTATNTSAIWR